MVLPAQVRRHAAEQLYVQMLSWEPGPKSFTKAEQEAAMGLLAETAWDGPLDVARRQCTCIAEALHVQLPALKLKAGPNDGINGTHHA